MILHNTLRENRVKKGLTQETLASMVGVTRQTIISIEKEKFVPSVKLALELSLALDMPIGSVFRLENEQGEKR